MWLECSIEWIDFNKTNKLHIMWIISHVFFFFWNITCLALFKSKHNSYCRKCVFKTWSFLKFMNRIIQCTRGNSSTIDCRVVFFFSSSYYWSWKIWKHQEVLILWPTISRLFLSFLQNLLCKSRLTFKLVLSYFKLLSFVENISNFARLVHSTWKIIYVFQFELWNLGFLKNFENLWSSFDVYFCFR